MSKWLNNKQMLESNLKKKKPCHGLGYCPYGQLVEEFPLHIELEKYAIEKGRYSKLIKGKGWTPCKKDEKGASPDLNWATGKVKEQYSCKTFGHNCPVYYLAEEIVE